MKKKNLFFLVAFAFTCIQAKADIAPTVMLSHNGVRTMFMWDEVQKAVDAAVDGDTIYLSNGSFAPFNVTKRIMVRGTGDETIVEGNCTVYIGGQTPLSMPVLDALTFTGDVSVTSAYKQFTIRKCQMNNLNFTESDFRDVKLDRCDIQGTLHLTQKVKEFNCFNTKIKTLMPYDYKLGNAYFNHCNIRQISDTIVATFDNCVLRYCKAYVQTDWRGYNSFGTCIGGCVLNYCIFPPSTSSDNSSYSYYLNIGNEAFKDNCFFFNPSVTINNCFEVSIGADDVVGYSSSSYLGSDGTMVGCFGGQHPFRRTPELPRVTKSAVQVDAVNKKLNVTLTLSKE